VLPALIALATMVGPRVDSTTEQSEVRRVVRQHREQIFRCNELAPMEDSLCTGWVNVKFWVAADGRVARTRVVRNTLKNTAIPECLERTIGTWRFRRAGPGPLEVVYPFHFRCAW